MDELPIYAGDDTPEAQARPPAPHLRERIAQVRETASALVERIELRDGPVMWSGGSGATDPVVPRHQGSGWHFHRYLLMAPDDAVAAYDRWRSDSGLVLRGRGRTGGLVLRDRTGEPPPASSTLRTARAGLLIGWRHVPVPMDLELASMKSYMVKLELRLSRRWVKTIGSHRRQRYFDAGNAVLDRLTTELFAARARSGG